MGITQLNFEFKTKVEVAIETIRLYEPPEGYYLADSGGKDSTAVRLLTKMSGVKFDAHYCVSPIDPPQIYKFLKEHHPDTIWDYHARGFWKMVQKRQLPLRTQRWCCEVIKESGGIGRVLITGVRREESASRSHYPLIETDREKDKTYLRPIVDWSYNEVWELIKENKEPYCGLYNRGFKRIGCILCPYSTPSGLEELYFPKITALWLLACTRLIESGAYSKYGYKTGQELYDWWTKRG